MKASKKKEHHSRGDVLSLYFKATTTFLYGSSPIL